MGLFFSASGYPGVLEPEGCPICLEAVQKLMDLSNSNMAVQEYVLTRVVCLEFPSQMQCISGVMQRWSRIFKTMYKSEEIIPMICNYVNTDCSRKGNIGKFYQDCDSCKEDLKLVVEAASDDENIEHFKILLNGEAYCKGEDTCVQFIEEYFSGFVKGLADHLIFQRIGTCSDLYGVCE